MPAIFYEAQKKADILATGAVPYELFPNGYSDRVTSGRTAIALIQQALPETWEHRKTKSPELGGEASNFDNTYPQPQPVQLCRGG